jgi:ubiquitin-conjugating enzyme E2 S
VNVLLVGPPDTPYEGGFFKIRFTFPPTYPEVPPTGVFCTKVFHPNVSTDGSICVDTLKTAWQPTLSLSHVLTTISCLLINPNAESALNEEAGKVLLGDFAAFTRQARLWTKIHAKFLSEFGERGREAVGDYEDDGGRENVGNLVGGTAPLAAGKPSAAVGADPAKKRTVVGVKSGTGVAKAKRKALKRL